MTDPRSGAGDLGPGENAPGPSSFPGRVRGGGRRPLGIPRPCIRPLRSICRLADAFLGVGRLALRWASRRPSSPRPPREVFGDRLALARDFARSAGHRRRRARPDRPARGAADLGTSPDQLRRDGGNDPYRRFCGRRGFWCRFARYRAGSGPARSQHHPGRAAGTTYRLPLRSGSRPRPRGDRPGRPRPCRRRRRRTPRRRRRRHRPGGAAARPARRLVPATGPRRWAAAGAQGRLGRRRDRGAPSRDRPTGRIRPGRPHLRGRPDRPARDGRGDRQGAGRRATTTDVAHPGGGLGPPRRRERRRPAAPGEGERGGDRWPGGAARESETRKHDVRTGQRDAATRPKPLRSSAGRFRSLPRDPGASTGGSSSGACRLRARRGVCRLGRGVAGWRRRLVALRPRTWRAILWVVPGRSAPAPEGDGG